MPPSDLPPDHTPDPARERAPAAYPASAHETDAERPDEPSFAREALAPDTPQRGIELRPLLNALSLLVVLLLVLAAVGLGRQSLSARRTAAALTPTLLPTPAPTLPAGQGWSPTGPAWAQQIAFAPSDPATAYICGTPAAPLPTHPQTLALGVSPDFGQTWQTLTTPFRSTTCRLTINPTDARDVLLEDFQCLACVNPGPANLYRTFDGGRHWRWWPLPARGTLGPSSYAAYTWAWQGSALIVLPFAIGAQPQPLLAVSASGAPFAWVDQNGLLAGAPPDAQLNTLTATASAIYVDVITPASCSTAGACTRTMRSTDLGASWSLFQPSYQSQPVYLFTTLADGLTLIGQAIRQPGADFRTYVHSRDGGATWAPLPSPPGNLILLDVASTPSGTLYAETWSFSAATATPGVYRLTPGALAWTLIAALPGAASSLVVASNALGQPLALWGGVANVDAGEPTSGLTTHTP